MLYPKRKMRRLVADGEYYEAIELGRQIEQKRPDDHDLLFIMGSAYYIVEDAQNAITYFEKALRIKGDDVESLKLKTNAHLALGQKEEAITAICRVLEVDPGDAEAKELFDQLQGVGNC